MLLEERNALDLEVRKHAGAISPLRRMPPELLSLIFEYTLAYSSAEVWNITAVCSGWRAIALSQPSLWSTVVLDFSKKEAETERRLLARLERSREAPLTIKFLTWDENECSDEEWKMLGILASYRDRWETVEASGPEDIYDHISGELPVLRELRITIHPSWRGRQTGDFADCPRLHFVSINPSSLSDPLQLVWLPFFQLLRFSGSNSWTKHLHSLRSAENLVDCILHCTDTTTIIPSSQSTVTLPSLLRLSVSTTDGLEFLDTPALQELYCDKHAPHIYSFLKRVDKLQKLVAPWSSDRPAPDLARLLRAAPTITTLGLYVPIDLVADLFSILAPTAQNKDIIHGPLPALKAISLRVVADGFDVDAPPPELDQDVLMEALESQWHHGSWRSVKLYCPELEPSPRTLARMEVLCAEGMQVEPSLTPEEHCIVISFLRTSVFSMTVRLGALEAR
ncbi:hypothetical protein DFH07DRAFT_1059307 [Mycena maculata]|uniref:F-box domain-containing protein n=1 Tax=Mycena maculata TaxID=230809 RepID=A0AAD7JFA4_9AGAR|nr:hypothetical protein DFH07DRAFT_1059307 [Mycena maculata]